MIIGGIVSLAGKIIQELLGCEWGYGLIVAAFLLNGGLLFFPFKGIKKDSPRTEL
jgi:hypothetical protein